MKIKELRNLTAEELEQKEAGFRKELFNLRFQKVTGEIENPMRIKQVKKGIARSLTIAGDKKRAAK